MVQPSPDPRWEFESQIRECYGKCAYTHKTHEKKADRFDFRQGLAKWSNIILSALISGGVVSVVFAPGTELADYARYPTAALSVLSLIFNAYIKNFDPGKEAQRHREAAAHVWNVRESYISLLTDTLDPSIGIDTLRKRRDALQKELYKIYQTAPSTDGKAYGAAQTAIKEREELSFSEKELDSMLPTALRREGRSKPEEYDGPRVRST